MTHSPGMTHPAAEPSAPGQDSFAAIQEIVGLLEADPSTDWASVNVSALREHLVDMDRVFIDAVVTQTNVTGGFAADVTGSGRTVEAIQRMLPEHVRAIQGHSGWGLNMTLRPDGAHLVATATDAAEATHLRALGVFGILVTDAHHPTHHWMIANGQPVD